MLSWSIISLKPGVLQVASRDADLCEAQTGYALAVAPNVLPNLIGRPEKPGMTTHDHETQAGSGL